MLFNKLKEMFSEMILKKNADLIPHYYHYEFLLCANDIITNYNEFLDSNIKHYASNVEYQIEYDTETFLEEKDKIAGRIWLTTKKPNEPAKTIEVSLKFSLPLPKPAEYVSSYLDQSNNEKPMEQQTGSFDQPSITKPKVESDKNGIEKPVKQEQITHQEIQKTINNLKKQYDVSAPDSGDPVHMIGEKGKAVQPLLKLLGIALTHNMVYPKSAVDFNIRGTALLGFMLYPDGHITDVQVLKSSKVGVLDQAAVSALVASSPLKNITEYVKKPQYMVIGIMFG